MRRKIQLTIYEMDMGLSEENQTKSIKASEGEFPNEKYDSVTDTV